MKRWQMWVLGLVFLGVGLGAGTWYMVAMPGKSAISAPGTYSPAERALAKDLRGHVTHLAGTIGVRSVYRPKQLKRARDYVESHLRKSGYAIRRVGYVMQSDNPVVNGQRVDNIEASRKGTTSPDEIVVIGAHYDSVGTIPGANDNASGTAGLLALARHFSKKRWKRTVRFVAFVNEEPPFFQNSQMGSLYYARTCRAKNEKIVAMLSLETIGYYSDAPGSQSYPPPINLLYPSKGHFIGFVSNLGSRSLLHRTLRVFRKHARIPSEGIATYAGIPGIGWSDQWAFWQAGYPGVMITDTAPFRYRHYHKPTDTPDKLDYQKMALVIKGLVPVVEHLGSF
jgi:Zn-dependent M28 family amino/carboxypeptidase